MFIEFTFPGPQLHQAMISRGYVQPTFEILNGVFFQTFHQFFKYLHCAVPGIIAVFEVFEANAINQRCVTGKQLTQDLQIARLLIEPD